MKNWRYRLIHLGLMIGVLLLQACAVGGLYKPSGKGPFPAVIVLHTSYGIADHLIDFAEDLSSKGYVTSVVDYLSPAYGRGHKDDRIKEELRIITEAYDQFKAQPYVDAKRIGMVGFSLGANRALLFAVQHPERKIGGIVNYYAGCMRFCGSMYPNAGFPPILFLHGESDLETDPFVVDDYCDTLKSYGHACEFHSYKGVDHGFDQDSKLYIYDSFATADAFKRAVAFLDKHVKGNSK